MNKQSGLLSFFKPRAAEAPRPTMLAGSVPPRCLRAKIEHLSLCLFSCACLIAVGAAVRHKASSLAGRVTKVRDPDPRRAAVVTFTATRRSKHADRGAAAAARAQRTGPRAGERAPGKRRGRDWLPHAREGLCQCGRCGTLRDSGSSGGGSRRCRQQSCGSGAPGFACANAH